MERELGVVSRCECYREPDGDIRVIYQGDWQIPGEAEICREGSR